MMPKIAKPTPIHKIYPQPVNCGSFSMLLFNRMDILTSIVGTFFSSNPSAIIFRIMPIYVDSIYKSIGITKLFNMFKVTFIHIISKFFKRFPKTFNASFAIQIVFMTFGIITASFYSHKSVIKTLMTTTAKTMRKVQKTDFVSATHTSTRFGSIISKIGTWNNLLITTIALTKKKTISPFINPSFFNNQEFLKLLSY